MELESVMTLGRMQEEDVNFTVKNSWVEINIPQWFDGLRALFQFDLKIKKAET